MKPIRILSVAAIVAAAFSAPGTIVMADEDEEHEAGAALLIPVMNAERGQRLFAEKGCVVCHQVNGVGGDHAPSFDEEEFHPPINPFSFAADMWNHADPMIEEQEEDLGGQIELEGQDLADIVAFLATPELRESFSEALIPADIREVMEHEEGEHEEEEEH